MSGWKSGQHRGCAVAIISAITRAQNAPPRSLVTTAWLTRPLRSCTDTPPKAPKENDMQITRISRTTCRSPGFRSTPTPPT